MTNANDSTPDAEVTEAEDRRVDELITAWLSQFETGPRTTTETQT